MMDFHHIRYPHVQSIEHATALVPLHQPDPPQQFRILVTFIGVNLLPNGKSFKLYGASSYFVFDKRPFLEDWAVLFMLLEEGKIKPVIARKFPILEVAQANALLESGQVTGNVVLLAPELL